MIDADADDPDLVAGEYVLGTLEPQIRDAFQVKLAMDRELQARVAWWDARLAPLADAVPPLEPSPAVWRRIAAQIARGAATAPAPGRRPRTPIRPSLWQSVGFWRIWAGTTTLAAASLAAWLVLAPQPPRLIAVLGAPGEPSWLLTASAEAGELQARVVGPLEPGPRAHELWLVPADAAPISLGVLGADRTTVRPLPTAARPLLVPGAVVAVSLEPEGGSPTGQPTGPILYTGRLIADRDD
jgi:anti-sigma-K factor RskA